MSDKAQATGQKYLKEKRKKESQEREKDNARVKQWLNERIKRNEEMGLGSSPKDADIEYDDELQQMYGSNVPGGVRPGTIKIQLNPESDIKGDEFMEKYVTGHELEHVNQKRVFEGGGEHEKTWRSFGDDNHEIRRRARSILQPAFTVGDFQDDYSQGKYTNMPELLKKYAKQAGVPVDEIIDALVMNSAVGNDKDAKAAHDKTKENQGKGRGMFGELFEKKMSTKEVYEPWEKLKKRVPEKKKKKE
jgi:hypothetical protein